MRLEVITMRPIRDCEFSKKNRIFVYFIACFAVLFAILLTILFFIQKEVRYVHYKEISSNEERIVMLEQDLLGREFNMILADLHYLHHAYEASLVASDQYTEVAKNWSIFLAQRAIYDQMRYIDAHGDERIRINLTDNGGYIVPQSKLQNKKDRYYFYETAKLNVEDVYVSPLDLNIEHGLIEEPYKPMMRFSTPLYHNGVFQGMIILNYMAENIINDFRELASSSRGDIILLNSKGYWLSHSNSAMEWNFMFENRQHMTFQKDYPREWEAIRKGDGQFLTENGLYTSTPVKLQYKMEGYNRSYHKQNIILGDGLLYIVSNIPKSSPYSTLFNQQPLFILQAIIRDHVMYFIYLAFVALIIATLIHINRKNYERIKFYSEYDSLTRAYNRRAGLQRLSQLFPSDDRRSSTFCLCFIDINGLKAVNDILGHEQGDELIVTVAELIMKTIRKDDFLIRLGGDEFLIVFNDLEISEGEAIWSGILKRFENINVTKDRPYIISVSHGFVDNHHFQQSDMDALIKMADEKMYQEKRVIKENIVIIR